MKMIDTTPKLYNPEEAERIAAEMAEMEEGGWTYTAKHDPKGAGYGLIEIRDEDGEFVAYSVF